MRFSIATDFHDALAPLLAKSGMAEAFGKLPRDAVGGGRPADILPRVSKDGLRRHVETLHKNGLEFNYLLNAVCLGNVEFMAAGKRRILALLDWIESIGADSVTVALPYLCELARKSHPRLDVCVSTFANVDRVEKAKYWEGLGVRRITLASRELNRDFPLLRRIRSGVRCELQLIANNACLLHCPIAFYHQQINSQASRTGSRAGGGIDYCVLRCNHRRFADPVNFLASDWIRPEDVRYYEEIGIDSLKLVDRSMPSGKLARIAEAYAARRYDGNLLDILHTHFKRHAAILSREPGEEPVFIDNRKLDGFLEHPPEHYEALAKKAVRIDPAYRRAILAAYKKAHDAVLE
ncbi:MAG: U32 family peptidase [Elusimicrobiota bacterium]